MSPLKKARLAAGLTQKQVADLARISQSRVARIEGGHGCSPRTAARLAAIVPGVTEMEILFPDRVTESAA